MDDRLETQWQLGQMIDRLYINMKKDGPQRRRNQQYISGHYKTLAGYWGEFIRTNEELLMQDSRDHKYFKEDFFNKVKVSYEAAMQLLHEEQQLIKVAEKTPTPGTAPVSEKTPEDDSSASGKGKVAANTPLDKPAMRESVDTSSTPNATLGEADKQAIAESITHSTLQTRQRDSAAHQEAPSTHGSDQTMRYRRQQVRYSTLEKHLQEIQDNIAGSPSKSYLEYKERILLETWEKITSLHEEILIHENNENQVEHHWVQYNSIEQMLQDTLCILQDKLKNNSRATENNPQEDWGVRLPQITIPIFDGNYKLWTSFHDIYTKMIHTQRKISDAVKMQYLKCYLRGEASRLIQHLLISDCNYEAAWKLLCDRYNNKRLLLSTYLDMLLNQPTLVKESAQELKQLHDKMKESLQGIRSLDIETESWGPLLAHILTRKLDKESYKLYEQHLSDPKAVPDFNELLSFLENRFQSLESIETSKKRDLEKKPATQKPFQTYQATVTLKCAFCSGNHSMFKCPKQQNMSARQKIDAVKRNKLCLNCLRKGHDSGICPSKNTCLKCHLKHNTLLHDDQRSQDNSQRSQDTGRNPQPTDIVTLTSAKSQTRTEVLLATAVVNVRSKDGSMQKVKALIDQGSQASFISERAAQNLGLKRTKTNVTVTGIHAQYKNPVSTYVIMKISPHFESCYEVSVKAFVLNKLNHLLPEVMTDTKQWNHLQQITLADPEYQKQGKIDIILGADVYGDIMLDGMLKGAANSPIAQQTELGWIISGRCGTAEHTNITSLITKIDLEEIKRFWELEEVNEQREITQEEKKCVEHYENTVLRDKDGRYIVRLPFNNNMDFSELGDSKKMAMSRLLHMEKKFRRDRNLEKEYKQFMREYLELGHMKLCDSRINTDMEQCFLPHHAVIKEDNKTTKLRVVFDASARTSNGVSLNSILYTGPQLQADLYDILLQWRKFKFVFKADITKMFRQIRIHEDDQRFQKILWRFSEKEVIQEYQLTTVTYGTRPAPFLAVKTMQHLAEQQKSTYPRGAEAVMNNFYMDDLLAGGNTIENARLTLHETIELLKGAGFELRKWCSNHNRILCNIPLDKREQESGEIRFNDSVKTLGLHWNPHKDSFVFKVNIPIIAEDVTKRSLLSEASKLFDPIGWLAPTIIKAKLIFQELWQHGLEWDDKLPTELAARWREYKDNLPYLETISIPRWVNIRTNSSPCELHGFSDASEKAYAAVVYLKTYDTSGDIVIHLISAKTKVAPNRKKTSLPRLELCAALLLTKLMQKVAEAMDIPFAKKFAWTDSEIVLAWLSGNPNKYKTFVANRISKIQTVLQRSIWHYVKSKENPADCASRGITPRELINHPLWWNGPGWLRNTNLVYEQKPIATTQEESKRATFSFGTLIKDNLYLDIIERYSSLKKGINVLAYCLRFVENTRRRKTSGPLTTKETKKAANHIIRAIQVKEFPDEFTTLNKGHPVRSKSSLLSLNPFLDENGVIRVGGRLENSELNYEAKHPVILPYKSHFTRLIISDAHKETMHGGVNLTLSHTRHKYWIVKGYSAVKQQIRNCVICTRYNARTQEQLMGNLPKPRLTLTRPFTNTGVDYAGPLSIKAAKGRGTKTYKGYIAVFICLATKAIHLEAVSDLSANAFIAAFKRLIGRRGIPRKVYSDNATNFQLAAKILEKTEEEFKKQYQNQLLEELKNYEIEWSFIPPAAPHFGGMWEAGVKSMKHHLKRTIGQTALTFEELTTVLVSIEACLNSRPLCPMTDDPTDLSALTPGHFLIGTSLLAPPGKDTNTTNTNIQSRWKMLEYLSQQFWKKWSNEYLHRLQCRPRWTSTRDNVKVNDLVLVKDEALPPAQWSLGRIEETYPGSDNLTRVVTIRTRNKLIKRPLTKICILPVTQPHEESTRCSTKRALETEDRQDPEDMIVTKRSRQRTKIRSVTGYPNLVSNKESTQASTPRDEKGRSSPKQATPARRTLGNMALLVMMTLLLVPAPATPSKIHVDINPFHSHPGIYFEDLGVTQLMTSKWNMLVYYDLQHYWQELQGLRNCVKEIHNLCNSTVIKKHYCTAIHEQFERQLQQLEEVNYLIHQQGSHNQEITRQRRSPLDIVGKAANYLFGILDADYAKELDEKLEKVDQDESHLFQLIKNQTSIVDATVNIMKRSEETIQNQFQIIQDHIKDLMRQVQQGGTIQEREQTLNTLIAHTTLVLYNYERVQRSIIDVLTDLHHGRINPLLITPLQLRAQLRLIRENIPHTLTLPETGHTNMLNLYRLMTAAVRVMDSRILFQIRLPLLQNEKYQLFHLVPVPTPYKDHFTFIQPETPYLIVDLHRENYYPLTQSELDKCIHFEDNQYFCQRNHPIYNTNSRRGRCEMNLLRHIEGGTSDCTMRKINPSKIWIQLRAPNSWLYVMDKEYTFNIVCDTAVISRTLKGEGILKLSSECEIKQDSMTIAAHGLYTTQLNSSFIPSINISQILAQSQKQEASPSPVEQHWQPNYHAYSDIKRRISELQQKEGLPQGLSGHDIHHYTVTYILVAVVTSAAVFITYKYLSSRRQIHQKQAANNPTPAQRSWKLPSSELHI